MNGRLARALKEEGVLGFVRLVQRALRLANDPAQFPQTFVGGEWADRFRRAARGPSLTTSSMGGKSTETQHRKSVEVPTSVLERWLRFWTDHWNKRGLYDQGGLSVEVGALGGRGEMSSMFHEARERSRNHLPGRLRPRDENSSRPGPKIRLKNIATAADVGVLSSLHRYKNDWSISDAK